MLITMPLHCPYVAISYAVKMKGLTGQRLSLKRRETALCCITLHVVDRRRVRPTKQRKLTRVVAVTSYDQRLHFFPRFVLRLCRPCEINSETNMAGSSDPTKRAGSVLKEAIRKLEESYHLASLSTSDNSSHPIKLFPMLLYHLQCATL